MRGQQSSSAGRERISSEPRGWYLAGEVGQLAGVSGERVGQWARRGYIRSSQSESIPRIYSFQDIAEAMVVHELLDAGVRHREILQTVRNLRHEYGDWPLQQAPLATTDMRAALSANSNEFLLLIAGNTRDAAHGIGTQLMLDLPLGLRAVAQLLRRGGWVIKTLPTVTHIEVDP